MNRPLLFSILLAGAAALTMSHAEDVVYFPKGKEKWYPAFLAVMKEPSLFQKSAGADVEQYRFLWLRTFHQPIAVRVRKDASGITLRVIRLSGQGGYEPGSIEHEASFALTEDQWDAFLKELEAASFWTMPTEEDPLNIGLDGSRWVLEGRAAGKYHFVDRWSPSSYPGKRGLERFVACCRHLLTLSKLATPEGESY